MIKGYCFVTDSGIGKALERFLSRYAPSDDVEEKTVEQFTITTTPHVMLSVSEPSLHDQNELAHNKASNCLASASSISP